jgi:hypothetical protein
VKGVYSGSKERVTVAQQTTEFYWLGVNKIPPNFNTMLATSIEGLWLSQEFTAGRV